MYLLYIVFMKDKTLYIIFIVLIILSIISGITYVTLQSKSAKNTPFAEQNSEIVDKCGDDIPYSSVEDALTNPGIVCTLNLGGQSLTEIPQAIEQLVNLEKLELHGNRLTQIPQLDGKLSKLKYLNLGNNNLIQF